MIHYETLEVGMLDVNCYIVYDSESKRGIIIDPGGDAESIHDALIHLGVTPEAIVLTHAHFDHIGGIKGLVERYSIPTWISANDRPLYDQASHPVPSYFPSVPDLPPANSDEPPAILNILGGTVIFTPGHTPGGVCFYFAKERYLFSGDTLFCNGVGRTDFPGGSEQTLWNSINQKLFTLPGDTCVFPGHGPATTIADEKHN